jgi:hypothetical protein
MRTDTPRTDSFIHWDYDLAGIINLARTLERENTELRRALEPFAVWSEKHGTGNLVGKNGAIITGDDWRRAWTVGGIAR